MDSINPAFNQKYTFIKYHVNVQLRKWKVLKPYFETKLTEDISPAVRSVMVQCLTLFGKQITAAMSNLAHVINYINVIFTVYDLRSEKTALLDDAHLLHQIVFAAQHEAGILLDKFRNSEPIPFKKLPYEFQNRLVALLPLYDLTTFNLAGNMAAKSVKRRRGQRGKTFSNCLIVNDDDSLSSFTEAYENDKYFDVLDTTCFHKLDYYYVNDGLYLISNGAETVDHAVKIVSGSYQYVDLRCPYTWRQAIHLMSVSNFIKFTCLRHTMQLEVEDFDEFFKAVVQWLHNKKSVLMFRMVYYNLDITFRSRFEAVIKAQTQLNIHFLNGQVVVYKPINL
uniref:Uncharacterized protein n=1 Tax=Panagrellus redivivus TaxID=6233 RepID=A0A7E4UU25_PANRE